MEKILVCIDGSTLSRAVCDYGIFISKQLDLPLILLNVVEHSHLPKKLNLSGNIGLGARENILEELANEEMSESKQLITKGRAILKEYEKYALENGAIKCQTLQRHGTLEETLDELSPQIKIAIIGLKGEETSKNIGSHVEELIRNLNIPILLVNSEFKPINSILMAYDGSDYANKAIKIATQNPIFPKIKRYIANVNKDTTISNKLLNEAKNLFGKADFEVETKSLSGDSVEELLNYQDENNIDIIAMGAYSHNRLKSAIFGSFTTKMFLKAKKPLLLFR